MSERHKIVIAGAGGMGSATGLILKELGDFEADLFLGDSKADRAQAAVQWIREGSAREGAVEAFHLPENGSSPELDAIFQGADILLDCLPGAQATRMARLAREYGLHYANLTEHVRETAEIMELAAGAEQGFLLQTGLAPGFVNVLACRLFNQFCRDHQVSSVDRIVMRVGALAPTAQPPHYYDFTWSTIGVATEYVEPATVIRNFQRMERPSLTEVQPVLIDGVLYEEALTSGGAADLPTSYLSKTRDLDYKTLRYPGHYAWAQALLDQAPLGTDRIRYLHEKMRESVPFLDGDDLVVIYASVEGRDQSGGLRRIAASLRIPPCQVGRHRLKAIQATTSAGLAESARLLLRGAVQGVCLQTQVDPERFLNGPFVGTIYR
ncbi:MAG TPA: saccharopine dehydrogenase C-terminal domain-containing protein [Thermoanaerobaculia bacterium]